MATPAPPTRNRLERREIPSLPKSESGMRNLPAWLISLLLHSAILATLGTFWAAQPKGTGAERDRPIGVAVVYETASGDEYQLDGGGNDSGENSSDSSSLADALPNSSNLPAVDVLSDLLPGAANAGGDLASAAGGLGLGEGGATLGESRGVPKVKTTLFGIEGEGTRFLYVFDRSSSMNGNEGRPLQSAKSELMTSIESLGIAHQFQIIFYNDTPLPFGGLGGRGPQLLKGDEASKSAAKRFVRDVIADGGTRHIDALRMALAMGPDVVFFLTDADQPAPAYRDIDDIHTRASRAGATIHSIQFGSGPSQTGGGWIKQLASGTLGQYRYVDVTQLQNR